MLLLRFSASLVLATGICSHGLKKRSLSASGAVAAFVMGVLHMTCGWTFGLVLICFFATSSKVRTCMHCGRPTRCCCVGLDGVWQCCRRSKVTCDSVSSLLLWWFVAAADEVPSGAEGKAGLTYQARGAT